MIDKETVRSGSTKVAGSSKNGTTGKSGTEKCVIKKGGKGIRHGSGKTGGVGQERNGKSELSEKTSETGKEIRRARRGSSKSERTCLPERKVKSSKTRLSPKTSTTSQASRSSRTKTSSSDIPRSPRKASSANVTRLPRKLSSSSRDGSENGPGSSVIRISTKPKTDVSKRVSHDHQGSTISVSISGSSNIEDVLSKRDKSSSDNTIVSRGTKSSSVTISGRSSNVTNTSSRRGSSLLDIALKDTDSYQSTKSIDSSRGGRSVDHVKSVTFSLLSGSSILSSACSVESGASAARKSSSTSSMSISCVTHGPSAPVIENGQRKCSRCVKRPMRTRMDKAIPASKKVEIPKSIAPLDKQRKLAHLQTIRNAYLKVTTLPVDLGKTADLLQREQQQRMRKREEMTKMANVRKSRMEEICQAYDLIWPFSYSPYLIRPLWLKQRQKDMSEYLHNVQAVVQSLERRDNLKTLGEMKENTNTLYRTTKKAAWKVIHVREDILPSLDILHDQDAAASYKDCLLKIDQTVGARPKVTVKDNCAPSYGDKPRASGSMRRYSIFTYRAKKYNLSTYRNQTRHNYSTTYMVKSIIWMNQVLRPRRSGRRNFRIAKQLRTVLIVRKLFYSHNDDFRRHLKVLLAEHATGLEDPRVIRKWVKFLETGEPPDKAREVLAMVAAVDKTGQISLSQSKPKRKTQTCEQCDSLKASIKQTAQDIARVRQDIIGFRSRENQDLTPEEREAYEALKKQLEEQEKLSHNTISVRIKRKKQARRKRNKRGRSKERCESCDTDMSSKQTGDETGLSDLPTGESISESSSGVVRQSSGTGLPKQEATSLGYSELAQKIVSDVFSTLSSNSDGGLSGASSRAPDKGSESELSTSTLASKIVSDVFSKIEREQRLKKRRISSAVETGTSTGSSSILGNSSSDTVMSDSTLASQIVAEVYARIAQAQSLNSSQLTELTTALSESFSDTTSRFGCHDSDTSFSNTTLASIIVSNVYSRIEQDRSSLSTPSSDGKDESARGRKQTDQDSLASQIVSSVYSQIEREQSLSTPSEGEGHSRVFSDSVSRSGNTDPDTATSNITLASQIVSDVFSRIEEEQSISSGKAVRDSDSPSSDTTLASQIVSNVFSRIDPEASGTQAKERDYPSSEETLASKIVSSVYSQIDQEMRNSREASVNSGLRISNDVSPRTPTPENQIIVHRDARLSSLDGNRGDPKGSDTSQSNSANDTEEHDDGASHREDLKGRRDK